VGSASRAKEPLEAVRTHILISRLCSKLIFSTRVGRVDDVIVMANGEKTVPGPIEGALLAHPLVKGALAFGRGRDQIGVLVEPHTALGEKTLEQFRNEIWYACCISPWAWIYPFLGLPSRLVTNLFPHFLGSSKRWSSLLLLIKRFLELRKERSTAKLLWISTRRRSTICG
jgi:hypothetical protein